MGQMNKWIMYSLIGFFSLIVIGYIINGPIETEKLPTSSTATGTTQSQHPAVIGTSATTAETYYRGIKSAETKSATADNASSNREIVSSFLIIPVLIISLWYIARGGKSLYLKEPLQTF